MFAPGGIPVIWLVTLSAPKAAGPNCATMRNTRTRDRVCHMYSPVVDQEVHLGFLGGSDCTPNPRHGSLFFEYLSILRYSPSVAGIHNGVKSTATAPHLNFRPS